MIKREYRSLCLRHHPDKGGDVEAFREVQAAFEILREVKESADVSSFLDAGKHAVRNDWVTTFAKFGLRPTQPWDYYAEAEQELMPPFIIALATSNRSKCTAVGTASKCCPGRKWEDKAAMKNIDKGEVRVGRLDPTNQSGGYGYWVHLACWRVPNRLWQTLPKGTGENEEFEPHQRAEIEAEFCRLNEVLFMGLSSLPEDARNVVIDHVMNKNNWARERNKKGEKNKRSNYDDGDMLQSVPLKQQTAFAAAAAEVPHASPKGGPEKSSKGSSAVAARPTNAVKAAKARFVVPIPGKTGVVNCLAGKTVVATGIFPELGGGRGLAVGKDKVTEMIKNFGGRVTSAVSGKTDILLVGKEPGMSKVLKARDRGITLITLHDMKGVLEGGPELLAQAPKVEIHPSEFSQGYISRRSGTGNSLMNWATDEQIEIASGLQAASTITATTDDDEKRDRRGKAKKAADVTDAGILPAPTRKRTRAVSNSTHTRSTRSSRSAEAAPAANEGPLLLTDGGSERKQNVTWVQCDKRECQLWRKVPVIIASGLPDAWYCSDATWNDELASSGCAYPQETDD